MQTHTIHIYTFTHYSHTHIWQRERVALVEREEKREREKTDILSTWLVYTP